MQGTIKKLTDKNFGFITPEEGEKDIFFHANELVEVSFDDLREGDAVSSVVDNLSNLVTLNKTINDMCLDQYKLERSRNAF